MMKDRDRILGAIRSSLDRRGSGHRPDLIQQHRQMTRAASPSIGDLQERFTRLLESQGGHVVALADGIGLPGTVLGLLERFGLPARIRFGADTWLNDHDWKSVPYLLVEHGPARMSDTAGLSRAMAGLAEVGSVVLCSGADNPVTLTFVPEAHIVVLNRQDIVETYEDAWARIGDSTATQMSRTVNFVAGPSRTADIGGRPVLGAHGPRHFAVILV